MNISAKPFGAISLTSAPAAKAFSEPVTTMARTRAEASISVSASPSSLEELLVERVERLRAVEPDERDMVLDLDDQRLVGHRRPPSLVQRQTYHPAQVWQAGHQKLERPDCTVRTIVPPQRGHGSPSRS